MGNFFKICFHCLERGRERESILYGLPPAGPTWDGGSNPGVCAGLEPARTLQSAGLALLTERHRPGHREEGDQFLTRPDGSQRPAPKTVTRNTFPRGWALEKGLVMVVVSSAGAATTRGAHTRPHGGRPWGAPGT